MIPNASRRLLILLALLPVLLVVTASLYIGAMAAFEGEQRTFWKALEWASETLTTTGYGADAQWRHPMMVMFVVAVQFLGVFLVYMLVPLVLLPLLEQRFELRLPRKAPSRLKDHVVIFRHGSAVETLIQELADAEIPVLIIELDEAIARSLSDHAEEASRGWHRRKVHVVHERSIDFALEGARLHHARAVVANGSDTENASVVLIARELGFRGEILALAEEPLHRNPLGLAGADAVITPRHVLGEALAVRASLRIQPRVDGIQQLGPILAMTEVRVDPESPLAGQTLRQSSLAREVGATVIGQWVTGSLDVQTTPDSVIEPRGILLAIGRPQALDRLAALAGGPETDRAGGPLIVVGYGEVGQKVVELLHGVGEDVVVVDRDPGVEGVDVHGDIVDPELLDALHLERAKGLILALDSDTATLFATLVVKGRAPDLPVIARVNGAENIDRMYRAEADFALSISQVSAQILAQRLLGLDTLALDTQLSILKTSADAMVAEHPSTLEIRKRTGCSVVAVERGDEILTLFDETFQFQSGDTVYVCGHHEATERFHALYGF